MSYTDNKTATYEFRGITFVIEQEYSGDLTIVSADLKGLDLSDSEAFAISEVEDISELLEVATLVK